MKFDDQNKRSLISLIIVSTVTSVVTTVLLFAWILPNFFHSDPVGWGANLGIKDASAQIEPKAVSYELTSTAQAADHVAAQAKPTPPFAVTPAEDPLAERQDTVALTIPPKQSLDYRLTMERDYDLDYTWTANGKTIYAELRGEATDSKTPSLTFAKLTSTSGKGFFIIPFNGQFGWHWQNKSDQLVTIRLTTKGTYQVIGQVYAPAPT
ncbi:hypothetical protein MGMO_41c00040 [Methyloglobulus morosus KoM1]|uniref:Transmembrane anchor protein n=1 Tax=Methyloglobulus morosus KoM1 TaxID=1116472 RepID=V5C882_9GAMM|nr:hypothetical protein [Methyloglobulus morosus]ESS72938.1 hypothetical protein MGMO_41c00040 [Methyloglobulus morosus KoM1]